MHQDHPFVTLQPSSYIHQHRARQPTLFHSSHELFGTRLHSHQLGSHVDTCLLRCWTILHNVFPVFISTIQNEFNLTFPPPRRFRFESCWLIQVENCGGSFRNAEGECKHDFQAEVNAYKCHRVHESYELKWDGERDAYEYRKKVVKEWRYNPDALIAKDKEILAAAEKLAKKEQSHAEIEIQAKGIWGAINSSNEKAQWEAKNISRASKAYKGKWKVE